MVYRNSWFLESRVTSATGALDVVVRTSAGFREIQSQRFAAIIGSVGFSLEHYCLLLEFASTDVGIATNVCCFILLTRYWGIVTVPGFLRVDRPQILTSGGRIVTLHLNYVADYTGPLLVLFERTHNYYVDNQGLVPWRLRRLGRSIVRSDSSVRCVPGSNR